MILQPLLALVLMFLTVLKLGSFHAFPISVSLMTDAVGVYDAAFYGIGRNMSRLIRSQRRTSLKLKRVRKLHRYSGRDIGLPDVVRDR